MFIRYAVMMAIIDRNVVTMIASFFVYSAVTPSAVTPSATTKTNHPYKPSDSELPDWASCWAASRLASLFLWERIRGLSSIACFFGHVSFSHIALFSCSKCRPSPAWTTKFGGVRLGCFLRLGILAMGCFRGSLRKAILSRRWKKTSAASLSS